MKGLTLVLSPEEVAVVDKALDRYWRSVRNLAAYEGSERAERDGNNKAGDGVVLAREYRQKAELAKALKDRLRGVG